MSESYGFLHTGHTLLFCEFINDSKTLILKKEVKKSSGYGEPLGY